MCFVVSCLLAIACGGAEGPLRRTPSPCVGSWRLFTSIRSDPIHRVRLASLAARPHERGHYELFVGTDSWSRLARFAARPHERGHYQRLVNFRSNAMLGRLQGLRARAISAVRTLRTSHPFDCLEASSRPISASTFPRAGHDRIASHFWRVIRSSRRSAAEEVRARP